MLRDSALVAFAASTDLAKVAEPDAARL